MSVVCREELLHLLNRRRFLEGSAALASVALMPWQALAQAAAPHSFAHGEAEVTIVSDGSLVLPLQVIAPEASPEQLSEIARRMGWTGDTAQPAANVPLIRTGDDLVIVDVGSGSGFQPSAGKHAANLAAAGIDPASVTKVVITHGHLDHCGGTLSDGALRFPNAAYYIGEAEWNFWMDPGIFSKLPPEMADFIKGVQRDFGAVKDKVTMVKGGDEVVSGLAVIDTPGHTPGHISLELAGADGLLITADAMPNNIVSFEHPGWTFGFDAIPDLAVQNRRMLVDRAANEKMKLLGYHWTWPGVGNAEQNGDGYRFVPVA